jgi:hypothetical protein
MSSGWNGYLATASADWSISSVLDTVIIPGTNRPKTCKPTAGRVEVCNAEYGNNGWLGIASIWASGTHITQGTAKMNDTYFKTNKYNTPAWKNFVLCQEIGHTFGLDHQDEIFTNANLGTCMDYTSNPSTNQHPNAHDYEELEIIYSHADASTTIAQSTASLPSTTDLNDPKEWGKEVRRASNGSSSLFARDLANGQKIFTFVVWADGDRNNHGNSTR